MGIPYKILVDMDGVIADWNAGIVQLTGHQDVWQADPLPENYDVWKKLFPDLYDRIAAAGEDWWANLAKTPEADELMAFVEEKVGKQNVAIWSSPVRTGTAACVAGKMRWLEKHFPDYVRRCAFTPVKHFAAHSKSVLIDDTDEKVWDFHQHGGLAVRMPRPWNLGRGFLKDKDGNQVSPLVHVKDALTKVMWRTD